jgi:hypothetical protein
MVNLQCDVVSGDQRWQGATPRFLRPLATGNLAAAFTLSSSRPRRTASRAGGRAATQRSGVRHCGRYNAWAPGVRAGPTRRGGDGDAAVIFDDDGAGRGGAVSIGDRPRSEHDHGRIDHRYGDVP